MVIAHTETNYGPENPSSQISIYYWEHVDENEEAHQYYLFNIASTFIWPSILKTHQILTKLY